AQFLVISTSVDGRKHGEQSLTGVERHGALVLRRRQLCQQGKHGRVKRASKPGTQGNLLQAGRNADYDLTKCKGCAPQNQWTLLKLFIQKAFALRPRRRGNSYPFTLTLKNDSIAHPVV